jgi:hypothetical protein
VQAAASHYHFDKKDSAEIDRLIQDQFVPILRKAMGFQRYYRLGTGEGEGASADAGPDGEIIEWIGAASDVTARKDAESRSTPA